MLTLIIYQILVGLSYDFFRYVHVQFLTLLHVSFGNSRNARWTSSCCPGGAWVLLISLFFTFQMEDDWIFLYPAFHLEGCLTKNTHCIYSKYAIYIFHLRMCGKMISRVKLASVSVTPLSSVSQAQLHYSLLTDPATC